MAVDITQEVANIRNATYARDVRNAMADSLAKMAGVAGDDETFERYVTEATNQYLQEHPDAVAPTDEQVNAWLDANGVTTGATAEQAAQIERNTSDIQDLQDQEVNARSVVTQHTEKISQLSEENAELKSDLSQLSEELNKIENSSVSSVNMFNPLNMFLAGKYLNTSNGDSSATNTSYFSTELIEVSPSTTYTLSIALETNPNMNVCEYDAKGNFLKNAVGVGTFTTSPSTKFIRFGCKYSGNFSTSWGTVTKGNIKYYIQLEKGVKATSIEKYGVSIKDLSEYSFNNFATAFDVDETNKKTTFVVPEGITGYLSFFEDFNWKSTSSHMSSVTYYDSEGNAITGLIANAKSLLPNVEVSYGECVSTTLGISFTVSLGDLTYAMQRDYKPIVVHPDLCVPAYHRNSVYFLGDSFSIKTNYVKAVLSDVRPDTATVNGMNGSPITEYNNRLASVDLSTYDTLLVTGGANDFNLGKSLDAVKSAMDDIFRTVFTQNPNIEIVWIIPTYTYGYSSDSSTGTDVNSKGINIREYAEAIRTKCEEWSVKYYDAWKHLGINPLTVSTLTRDGLHPTDSTYQKMGHDLVKLCL